MIKDNITEIKKEEPVNPVRTVDGNLRVDSTTITTNTNSDDIKDLAPTSTTAEVAMSSTPGPGIIQSYNILDLVITTVNAQLNDFRDTVSNKSFSQMHTMANNIYQYLDEETKSEGSFLHNVKCEVCDPSSGQVYIPDPDQTQKNIINNIRKLTRYVFYAFSNIISNEKEYDKSLRTLVYGATCDLIQIIKFMSDTNLNLNGSPYWSNMFFASLIISLSSQMQELLNHWPYGIQSIMPNTTKIINLIFGERTSISKPVGINGRNKVIIDFLVNSITKYKSTNSPAFLFVKDI